MKNPFDYKGKSVTITIVQARPETNLFAADVWIHNTRHVIPEFFRDTPQTFTTKEEAMEFGSEVAKYIIDSPTQAVEEEPQEEEPQEEEPQ